MKFTIKWLKRYLETQWSHEDIVEKLNDIGFEVEKITDSAKTYNQFFVAQVVAVEPHPAADKLQICRVDNGQTMLQIVCGASNVKPGLKVVLAPIGAVIPANAMTIKQSTIRGVNSEGMLCSAEELQLQDNEADGILELQRGDVGQLFAHAYGLDDVVIEIALTPNRGDCASVFGIARDLAAAGVGSLHENSNIPEGDALSNGVCGITVAIEDKEACSEFSYRYIENVNNNDLLTSSEADLLSLIGYEKKTKLVDISNFIMFDLGRPNHIYDADKIKGNIIVRKSEESEKFHALNGKEYLLPSGITVIADQEKILSIAGVIGGESSKVEKNTRNILIEVANFHPHAVMAAARHLNINTESKFRFERHVDFANTQLVLAAITSMVQRYCGGTVCGGDTVNGIFNKPESVIAVDIAKIRKISGVHLDEKYILEVLNKLGFTAVAPDQVQIPSWRLWDVFDSADLAEEVLRIYGFSRITAIDLDISIDNVRDCSTPKSLSLKSAQDRLLGRGMHEMISWSFANVALAEKFTDTKEIISIQNPISSEMSVMRPSALCTLIPIMQRNYARGMHSLSLFELGPIYNKCYNNYQSNCLSGLRSGLSTEKSVHHDKRPFDFFDVKDDVFAVLSEFSVEIDQYKIVREAPHYYHPGRSASLKLGKELIAHFGALHPRITGELDLEQDALLGFEIFVEKLLLFKAKNGNNSIVLYDYQSVQRDFSFVVKKEVMAAEIVRSIKSMKIDIIDQVRFFDLYDGVGVPDGYKSVAFSIRLQPRYGTLKDAEIVGIVNQVINRISIDFGAKLRAQWFPFYNQSIVISCFALDIIFIQRFIIYKAKQGDFCDCCDRVTVDCLSSFLYLFGILQIFSRGKMRLLNLFSLAVGFIALISKIAIAKESDYQYCTTAINFYEKRYKLPKNLLHSIATIESGKWNERHKRLLPWPWTLNVSGKPYYFENKTDAVNFLKAMIAKGEERIDIGCAQINWYYHGKKHFKDPEHVVNPVLNAAYAAFFLSQNYVKTKNWYKAVAIYHSKTEEKGNHYALKVHKIWSDASIRGIQNGYVVERRPITHHKLLINKSVRAAKNADNIIVANRTTLADATVLP